MNSMLQTIGAVVSAIPAQLKKEREEQYSFEYLVAERKAFMSRKRLTYRAEFRLDNSEWKMHFTEMLKESGSGLSSGSDDMDMSPGVGFKKITFRTGISPREGTIEEQSSLFGKDYDYTFDFSLIRDRFKTIAEDYGYEFVYHIIGVGK